MVNCIRLADRFTKSVYSILGWLLIAEGNFIVRFSVSSIEIFRLMGVLPSFLRGRCGSSWVRLRRTSWPNRIPLPSLFPSAQNFFANFYFNAPFDYPQNRWNSSVGYAKLHSSLGPIYKTGIRDPSTTLNCRRQFHCALFSLEHRNLQINGVLPSFLHGRCGSSWVRLRRTSWPNRIPLPSLFPSAQKVFANTVLKPAIDLYYKMGFQKVSKRPSPYARCNIQMECVL